MTKIDSALAPWGPWMSRALQLAALADGCTSPNPLVGAVVLAGIAAVCLSLVMSMM